MSSISRSRWRVMSRDTLVRRLETLLPLRVWWIEALAVTEPT